MKRDVVWAQAAWAAGPCALLLPQSCPFQLQDNATLHTGEAALHRLLLAHTWHCPVTERMDSPPLLGMLPHEGFPKPGAPDTAMHVTGPAQQLYRT